MDKKISVVKNPDEPIAVEVIEKAIVDIGAAMKRINSTRLNRKALVVLIHHDTKLGIGTVEAVLECLDQLERTYLKTK